MPVTHLRITAKKPGFRRAGIAHPGHPVDHEIDKLTLDQIEALVREPNLVVHHVDLTPAPASEEDGATPPAETIDAPAPAETGGKGKSKE
ncbi:hypothetical protein AZA_35019 [Nitrospirillum viridazoti Y2]|uniref:Mu-like prophage FluMu N-terminal domain-containing protein n=1 Tax=Nitrospirillum amazonense TaxID=28077 RepID=A0A560IKG1_9PROT|nr:HI1506-related protein [Nitrospirillum amazonense]EGY02283.1 hypothetical protein AZA_35019 [Nitrospirillum amazonense Y2]TWB58685.1 hypothetical protein FBZ92_109178 [Nitrospirillum amazonense]